MSALRALCIGAAGLVTFGVGLLSSLGGVPPGSAAPSPLAESEVPAGWLAPSRDAAASCPGLPWSVLVAIGKVETDWGSGGERSPAGALGPMQFLPATFAAYDHPVASDLAANPPGGSDPPSVDNLPDALFAAARYLCANGGGDPASLPGAIFAYNHSAAYVAEVESIAATLSSGKSTTAQLVALRLAESQLGVPYAWGGESPGRAFDCSGLVQWSFAGAGISLPRVAQAQFEAGPAVPAGEALVAGDLVFFGQGPTAVTHVGIFAGDGQMIDAPHTGAVVRLEPIPTTPGAPWGSDVLVGATDP